MQGNYDEARKARRAAIALQHDLQQAKLKALQDAIGNYGDLKYIDLEDFIDPNNQNWADYKYYAPDPNTYLFGPPAQGHVNAGTPVGMFIQKIRDAENIDDVGKQLEIWNSYKPLDSYDNGRSYIRYFIPRFAMRSTDGSNPVQTTAGDTGGAQGVVTVGGAQGTQTGNTGGGTLSTQGVQAGAKTGNAVAGGGVQGSNNGSGGTQGTQAGAGVVKGGIQGSTGGTGTDGTYASSGVPKGGTKTIGYDSNPGNISIDKWNKEHGISYATGKDGVIYRTDPQHPNGYVDPFKNDLSTWTRATRSGSTYATPGINTGSTYATGEGIKDANGNVLTNPGGDWEYQYALKNPQYGLGMMGKMSDAQRNYLQAVSDDMRYKYNFTGAPRFV